MSRSILRCFRLFLAVLIIASLFIIATPSKASSGIIEVDIAQFDCATFNFAAVSAVTGGYAAVRLWVNDPTGPVLYDSCSAGYPSYYANLAPFTAYNPSEGITVNNVVSFSPQPVGTKLYARIYRALNAAPGSWDGGNYIDNTITCTNGVTLQTNWYFGCSYYFFNGDAYPYSGFVGVRIWVNKVGGTPIVDSYIAGYPSYFAAINSTGQFNGSVFFAQQPSGTHLVGRLYHGGGGSR